MRTHIRSSISLIHVLSDALTENGRLAKAETVLKCFAKIMSAHRGEILCTITTASVSIG